MCWKNGSLIDNMAIQEKNMPKKKKRERRPVTSEHPIIAAMVKVLRELGGPAKLSRIFEHAAEDGRIPATAENTIRGRASQHLKTDEPVLLKLPKRRGWMRSDTPLHRVKVTREWVGDAGAPWPLIETVEELGSPTVVRLLKERLDSESVEWLLETLPFDPDLAERLRAAESTRERRDVLKDVG